MISPRGGLNKGIPATRSSLLISNQTSESMMKLLQHPIPSSQSTRNLPQSYIQTVHPSFNTTSTKKEKEVPPPPKQSDEKDSRKLPEPDPEIIQISQDLIAGNIDLSSVDSTKVTDVQVYLRKYKRTVLKEPDYFTAQRIDDICSELSLLTTQNKYCNYRSTEIKTVHEHLKKAKSELQKVYDERKKVQGTFDDQKAKKIEKLEQQQQKELDDLDEKYNGELPPKFRKVSSEVLNIRRQETQLRNAKMYLEAQRMREEADALQAFELARQEVRFHNEGVENREKLLSTHRNQMSCLLENLDRQYMKMMPDSYAKEKHWKQVINQYERQLRKLKGDQREVKKVTNSMLSNSNANTNIQSTSSNINSNETQNESADQSNLNNNNRAKVTTKQGSRGLPSLGRKVPQTPMSKVLLINNKRAYSRFAVRRPKSTAF